MCYTKRSIKVGNKMSDISKCNQTALIVSVSFDTSYCWMTLIFLLNDLLLNVCYRCLSLSSQAEAKNNNTLVVDPNQIWWILGIQDHVACRIAFQQWNNLFLFFPFVWAVLMLGRQKRRKSLALQNSRGGMVAFYQKGHGRILQLVQAAGFCFSWPTRQPAHRLPQLLLNSRAGCISFGNHTLVSRSMTNRGSWWTGIMNRSQILSNTGKSLVHLAVPPPGERRQEQEGINKGPKYTRRPSAAAEGVIKPERGSASALGHNLVEISVISHSAAFCSVCSVEEKKNHHLITLCHAIPLHIETFSSF